MGMDLIDIKMRAEREFGVVIGSREFGSELLRLAEIAAGEAGTRVAGDITVQQLFSVVCNRIYHQHGRVPDDAWPQFVAILVDVLGVRSEEVTPQAWLNRDLGME